MKKSEKKDCNVFITQFEIIKPYDEFESIGEILTLSEFGEYCPKGSEDGYQLGTLLSKPDCFRPKAYYDRGLVFELEYTT